MKFGIHSLLFTETFVEKDLPLLEKFRNMGFEAVELLPFDPDNFPARQVRKLASDLGLTINTGYGMPAEYNTISPDANTRRRGIEFSKRLIDLSQQAGAHVLGGAIYCGWGYLTGKMRSSEEWNWAVESYREIAEYALQNSSLILGIEPLNRFESHLINIASDALRFIDAVGLPNVKVHLDTFHMIREENHIAQAIRLTGTQLGYFHACENQRGIPGTGLVPWLEVFRTFRQIGYDGCVTIESFDPNMPKIAKLCCIWRQFADSPEQLASQGLSFLREIHAQVTAEG